MDHDDFSCSFHRSKYGVVINRAHGTEIDDLDFDALDRQLLSSLEAVMDHQSVGDDAHVGAAPLYVCAADGQSVFGLRHLAAYQAVGALVLKEHDGVGVPDKASPASPP